MSTRANSKQVFNALMLRNGQELNKPFGTVTICDGPSQRELSVAVKKGEVVVFKKRTRGAQFTPLEMRGNTMYSPDHESEDYGGTNVTSLKLWGLRKIGPLFVPFHVVYQINETAYLRNQDELGSIDIRDVVECKRTGWFKLDYKSLLVMPLSRVTRYVLLHGEEPTA